MENTYINFSQFSGPIARQVIIPLVLTTGVHCTEWKPSTEQFTRSKTTIYSSFSNNCGLKAESVAQHVVNSKNKTESSLGISTSIVTDIAISPWIGETISLIHENKIQNAIEKVYQNIEIIAKKSDEKLLVRDIQFAFNQLLKCQNHSADVLFSLLIVSKNLTGLDSQKITARAIISSHLKTSYSESEINEILDPFIVI